MRTIAFVTQKGGSGKSTLASCIAVAAHEAGERVFVIDMDPLASLINWSKARGEQDIAVEAVPAGKLKAVLAALELAQRPHVEAVAHGRVTVVEDEAAALEGEIGRVLVLSATCQRDQSREDEEAEAA